MLNRRLLRPASAIDGREGHIVLNGGEICFSRGSPHGMAGVFIPDLAHALAGMAAPAPHHGVLGENAAMQLTKVFLMKVTHRGSQNLAAIVEQKTIFVGVAKIFETAHLEIGVAIHETDELLGGAEPHDLCAILCGQFFNFTKRAAILHRAALGILNRAPLVRRAVDQPGDVQLRAILLTNLLHAHAGGLGEIAPVPVMAIQGHPIFFILAKCRASATDDIFCLKEINGSLRLGRKDRQKQEKQGKKSIHGSDGSTLVSAAKQKMLRGAVSSLTSCS